MADKKDDKKTVTIFVDGVPHEIEKKETISYEEVIRFSYPDYPGNGQTYSVKYTRGHGDKPEGTLSLGGSVKVKEGMRFVISRSGES